MKSINKIVTTSIKPEFERDFENVKNELRNCITSKNIMSEKEQHDCYERYRTNIDNLNTKCAIFLHNASAMNIYRVS